MLNVYLAGEIHTNWREEIIENCKKEKLDIQFSSPVTDHPSSDDCGVEILGPEEKNMWKETLNLISNATNLEFNYVNDGEIDSADLRFFQLDNLIANAGYYGLAPHDNGLEGVEAKTESSLL